MDFPLHKRSGSQLGTILLPGDILLCPETILFGWRPRLLLNTLPPWDSPYDKGLSGHNVNSAEVEKFARQDRVRVNIQHPLKIQMSVLPLKRGTSAWNSTLE